MKHCILHAYFDFNLKHTLFLCKSHRIPYYVVSTEIIILMKQNMINNSLLPTLFA